MFLLKDKFSLVCRKCHAVMLTTRWFKYDLDDLCANKSQFVPVIFEPPCNKEVTSVLKHDMVKSHSAYFWKKFYIVAVRMQLCCGILCSRLSNKLDTLSVRSVRHTCGETLLMAVCY
jgi:hypothetical protein